MFTLSVCQFSSRIGGADTWLCVWYPMRRGGFVYVFFVRLSCVGVCPFHLLTRFLTISGQKFSACVHRKRDGVIKGNPGLKMARGGDAGRVFLR